MAWARSDDTTAFHPRLLRMGSSTDQRLLNEAWGFVHRCLCYSGQFYLDGFVPEFVAAQVGGSRTSELVRAAQRAGLFKPGRKTRNPAGDPGWQLETDVDELMHIRSWAEVSAERKYRQVLRDPEVWGPVRRRDGDHCRYCGKVVNWKATRSSRKGTLDHVTPGDDDTLVVACNGCNGRKQNQTPLQAGMVLQPPPAKPFYTDHTRQHFLDARGETLPDNGPERAPQPGATQQRADAAVGAHSHPAPDPAPLERAPQPGATQQRADAAVGAHSQPAPEQRPTTVVDADQGLPDQELPGRVGSGRAVTPTSTTATVRGPTTPGRLRGARGSRGRRSADPSDARTSP